MNGGHRSGLIVPILNEEYCRVDVCDRRGARTGWGGVGWRGGGLCHLMRCFQHLHEEGVDGRVADELEKKQVLQTLEANGAKCR